MAQVTSRLVYVLITYYLHSTSSLTMILRFNHSVKGVGYTTLPLRVSVEGVRNGARQLSVSYSKLTLTQTPFYILQQIQGLVRIALPRLLQRIRRKHQSFGLIGPRLGCPKRIRSRQKKLPLNNNGMQM
jgi:hypothetical protein